MMCPPEITASRPWRRGLHCSTAFVLAALAWFVSVSPAVVAKPNYNSRECGQCPHYCQYFYYPDKTKAESWIDFQNPENICRDDGHCSCDGYCCTKDDTCPIPAVGCGGVCCDRSNSNEVQKGFWEQAEEDAAQWFLKRAFRYAMGGCGLVCNFVIEVFFRQQRPSMVMSVDCWKLQSNETNKTRTTPADRDYPILDNALFTSAVNDTAIAQRKKQNDDFAAQTAYIPWKHKDAQVDGAFVVKVTIPQDHRSFTRGVPGGVHWLEEHIKLLYDDYSGCTKCCVCSIWISSSDGGKECLKRCSKNVRIEFNYNIFDYAWPDWQYDDEKVLTEKFYKGQNMPKGDYFLDPLLFETLPLWNLTPADEIETFPPTEEGGTLETVSLGCHVYPHPWNNERSDATTTYHASFRSRVVGATMFVFYLFW